MNKPTAKETAQKILDVAAAHGFKVSATNNIMTVTRNFKPGDNDEFVHCDMYAYDVLSLLPRTSAGSDWGTEGGGIGGAVALKSGMFRMNRSGGSKRVLNALREMLETN